MGEAPAPAGGFIEPDVVLRADTGEVVMVEAKYFSGLSGDTQLRSQFRALQRLCTTPTNGRGRALIYLTRDWLRPTAEIDRAVDGLTDEERRSVYWLSWSAAWRTALDAEKHADSPEARTVLKDMRHLLERKGLGSFAHLPEPRAFALPYAFDALEVQWPTTFAPSGPQFHFTKESS